jgi:hypothetical protein
MPTNRFANGSDVVFGGDLFYGNSTSNPLATSSGLMYSNSAPINFHETASTATNLKAYGISFLDASTAAGTMKKYTIDAPIKGIVKELILQSTIAPMGSSDATQVGTGSTNITIIGYGSTAINADLTNIAMQTPYTYVRLLGLSTSRWAVTDFRSASSNVTTYGGILGLSSGLSTGVVST